MCGALRYSQPYSAAVAKRALSVKKLFPVHHLTESRPPMIKRWQSMDEYHHFPGEMKVHFDPSERARMHHELWIPWQKLRSFDTDRAMRFPEPRYSQTGRPAINQPQILRSFIL